MVVFVVLIILILYILSFVFLAHLLAGWLVREGLTFNSYLRAVAILIVLGLALAMFLQHATLLL